MSRQIILSLLLVHITCNGLCAQLFHVSTLGDEDGILHRFNDHILKRSDGITWISSEYGIYEYDGKSVKHHIPSINSNGPYGELVLSAFLESKDGFIYFSTSKGVNKYNIGLNEFELLQGKEGKKIWSEENYLFDIQGPNLYYVSNDSIQILNQESKKHYSFIKSKSVKQFTRIVDDRLIVIACPWLNDNGYEVFSFGTFDKSSKPVLLSQDIHTSNEAQNLYPYFSDIILESDSTMWALADEGLYHINYINNNTISISQTPQRHSKFLNASQYIESIIVLSTKDNGIWLFDTKTNEFHSSFSANDGLTSHGIREVYYDGSILWASCISSSDIHMLTEPKYQNQFQKISLDGNDGQLFIDDSNAQVTHLSKGLIRNYSSEGQLSNTITLDQSIYGNQTCTFSNIINNFDHQPAFYICNDEIYTSDKSRYYLEYKNKSSLHAGVFLTDSTLIGLSKDGVFSFNLKQSRKIPLLKNGQEFKFTEVSRLHSDQDYLYVVENEKATSLFSNSKTLDYINIELSPGPSIFSIHTTPVSIYLATSEGVYQYDKKNISLTNHIPLDPLLEEPHIYKIFSHNNDLWMSSNQGILKYNLENKVWSVYKKENGYTTDFFLENKGIQTNSGHIWFDSDEEFVVFHPDSIRTYHNNANLLITDLKVNSKKITQQEIENASLSHKEKNISFSLSYPSYYLSKLNKILYKIEGLHENWQTSPTNQVQVSLAPGKYKVNAYGINAHGQKSDVSKLDIEVALPYWRTWWFFLISLAAVALGVSFIVRYIYKRRLYVQDLIHQNELEVQEKLSLERQRIAAEMHDELGGGLTSIRLISSKVRSSLGNDSRDPSLEKIEDYSLELIDNMRSIIWSMNSEFDTLGESVSYIRQFLVKTLNDNNIACQFKTSGNIDERAVSSDKRRAIFLTVKEIVHNILKHSKASQVQVDIAAYEELSITIADNGEGISASKINNPYNYGLRNIKDRIHNIGGTLSIANQNGVTTHIQVPL